VAIHGAERKGRGNKGKQENENALLNQGGSEKGK